MVPSLQQLDNQQLLAWRHQPGALILDVRTPTEWQVLGMLPGALGLPLQELPYRFEELPKDAPIAVICEHGVRSLMAAEFLLEQGFTTIANHTEGMHAWTGEREFPSP